jgi:hypothetical protein
MVTFGQRHALPSSPASGWWWICLLTAVLFAFHVNYVRIHLLTEVHHNDSATASAHAAVHHDDTQDGEDHEHDHGQHQPHSASEHQLQLAGKQQCPLVAFAFLLPETSLFLTLPEPLVVCSTFEHGSRPGESPPDPRQPRAPPTV